MTATRAPALGSTWAPVSAATATATRAAVTQRPAAVRWVLTPPPFCFDPWNPLMSGWRILTCGDALVRTSHCSSSALSCSSVP